MNVKTEAAEVITAKIASVTTYGAAGTTLLGWLLSNQGAVFFGIVGVVGGMAINWYYKRKADLRAQRADARAERAEARAELLTQARLRRIEQGHRTDTDLTPLEADPTLAGLHVREGDDD